MNVHLTRRHFLKIAGVAGGGLVLGVAVGRAAPAREPATLGLHPLIQIRPDGDAVIFSKNPEIGQGIKTALPMIVAEELGADWARVHVRQADWDPRLGEQFSGGSLGVLLNWEAMREAGAAARAMLIAAAAARWSVPPGECEAARNRIEHRPSGRNGGFEDFVAAAAKLEIPAKPALKRIEDFTLVGTPRANVDAEAIVTGQPLYAIDVNIPGMLHAVVVRAPRFGARVKTFDAANAKAIPGVVDAHLLDPAPYGGTVMEPNSPNFVCGVAVLAESHWAAVRGAAALAVEWDFTDASREDSAQLFAAFAQGTDRPELRVRDDGDFAAAWTRAARGHQAVYEVPFLAHIPMEPMNCTADVREGSCEIWAPTQNPEFIKNGAVKILGLPADSLVIHQMRCGGGFGRRFYADFAFEAILLSQFAKRPVQVIWSREDDIRHDFYRPAGRYALSGALDAGGKVVAWRTRLANASRSAFLRRSDVPGGTELDEYNFPAGLVPAYRAEYALTPSQVPLGQWRSVAASSHYFAALSFLDEMAALAGRDPIEFFLDFLGPPRKAQVVGDYALDIGRLRRVVERAAGLSGWGRAMPAGRGLGFAACYNQTAFVAEVVEVSVGPGNKLRVESIFAAVDCGLVVNPSGARAQVEGGILEGLAAALYGEVTIANGAAVEGNFDSYVMPRLGEAPALHVEFIASGTSPRGLGEPALPPVAPALCNAIFKATGRRLRRLPLGNPLKAQ